jgi:serine/threonine-protein kinase
LATRRDLELARILLGAGVVEEAQIREALAVQGTWLEAGRQETLEEALYALGILPPDALAMRDAPPLVESQPFSNYLIEGVLGEGGGSVVYAAVYEPNGMPVAVKVLDPVHSLRKLFRERFYSEAKLHIGLDHENIVAGYEVGNEGGYDFYSMDLIEGATVLEVIERRGHFTNEEALSITLQAARALEHLHEKGLIHRDIKPGNIMVEPSGRARLIDLGLARRVVRREGDDVVEQEVTVGTVEYLSPEQARGRADLDARADVYSLGMTLYHMVVGEVAFHGETDYEVMAKQVLSDVDAQKIKTRRIDPEIYYLIAKMSAKDRNDRYPSVEEAARVIEGYLPEDIVPLDLGTPPSVQPLGGTPGRQSPVGEPAPAPRPSPPAPSPTRKRRRRFR